MDNFMYMRWFLLFFCLLPLYSLSQDKWIIVTTINYPTEALKKLAKLNDWQLLVIGDKKTPRDWHLENALYLDIEAQQKLPYQIIKLLPFNHYCRKNIGYLYAIEHGAQIIYETDDDNIILNSLDILPTKASMKLLTSPELLINIYCYFGQPKVWPRGFPLRSVVKPNICTYQQSSVEIGIQQGLVNKDPDVDAIFRLTHVGDIEFKDNDPIALQKNCFCPFNSQNTFFTYKSFWGLYLPVYVPFRVCDIWRGYITQRLLWDLDCLLCFTQATAVQYRNQHDLMHDFIDEIELYTKSDKLINFLSKWHNNQATVFLRMQDLFNQLIKQKFLDLHEQKLLDAWIADLEFVGYKQPNLKNYR
jgi:hypothetical protein